VQQLLLVGAGGFLGSILRYSLSGLVYRMVPGAAFPYGTLAVNIVGCLAIGSLAGIAESRGVIGPELRLFLFIGVLGGFTTFSTFGYETFELARDGEMIGVLANVLLHVIAGLGAAWLGHALTTGQ
jgi:CrcB protein